jgi:hypothetical protein
MDMYTVSGKVNIKKATHTQPLTMVIGIAFSGPHSPLSVGIVCHMPTFTDLQCFQLGPFAGFSWKTSPEQEFGRLCQNEQILIRQ